jgi:mannose-6-phosphate isomerase-like protein (cupin superfamily)
MQERIKAIASRVREMRDVSGFSEETVAERLQIPVETYKRYEDGLDDIPASILFEFAQMCHVDLVVLLTGETPHMHLFTVTRRDKGVDVERRSQYKYQSLAANFIHKKAEPFLVTVEPNPGGSKPSTNSHPGQEFDYVIEGAMKVYIHDNEIILEEGDSIFFDSICEHAMEAIGDKPVKFLAIIL